MKRFLYSILAAVIALTGAAALAEASRPAGTHVNTLFTEGSFVVQIDVPGGDMGWLAEVIDPDGAAVTLYDADVLEDTFVARFDAAHDGEATILLRHFYSACACDQAMTWDLLVEGGEVKEVKGGSQTDSPADGELDPYLIGTWLDSEKGYAQLTLEKGAARGWDAEIILPGEAGAVVFKAGVYYDCWADALVYDKGKFFHAPITGGESGEDSLGEAFAAGTTGELKLTSDGEALLLNWTGDQNPGEVMTFVREDIPAETP